MKDTPISQESNSSRSFNQKSLFQMIAICPEETKSVLVDELKSLGAMDIREEFKAVHFSVSETDFYEVHLKLRTTTRLLKIIKSFAAKDERMLYDQARRIPWSEVMSATDTFAIEGIPGDRGEGVMTANTISKRIRESMQNHFATQSSDKIKVELQDPDLQLVAFVREGRCTLSVETSGKSLHKRGYRTDGHPAPIKETLAAAILKLLKYDGTVDLYDPMCGSGTIVIEGASMALGKAALIHRKKGEFGFERLNFFNSSLWRTIQDKARSEKETELKARVFASDINPKYIEHARENALRARVERYIDFSVQDFFKSKPPSAKGLLVTNLPYGERVKGIGGSAPSADASDDVKDFYKAIGDTLKRNYAGWTAAVLAAEDSDWKFIGLKPKKKFPLMNGSIPVKLLVFELYDGSKRVKS